MNSFWTNTIWFLLLGLTTIIVLVYTFIKAENKLLTLAFFLSIAGFTYMMEVMIFSFLKSYDYSPMILNNVSRFDDGLVGNIFSQMSISATVLLFCSRKAKAWKYVVASLIYCGIEELFLHLGIYSHNWYRTWMTGAALLLLFPLFRKAYDMLLKGAGRVMLYILIAFAVYVPYTHLISWPFKLLGYPAYSESLLPDADASVSMIFSITFTLFASTILPLCLFRLRWWWHAATIAVFLILFYTAYILRVVIYTDILTLSVFSAAQIGGMYLCVFAIEKLYKNVPKKLPTLPVYRYS